jgi:hypothetical protein
MAMPKFARSMTVQHARERCLACFAPVQKSALPLCPRAKNSLGGRKNRCFLRSDFRTENHCKSHQ